MNDKTLSLNTEKYIDGFVNKLEEFIAVVDEGKTLLAWMDCLENTDGTKNSLIGYHAISQKSTLADAISELKLVLSKTKTESEIEEFVQSHPLTIYHGKNSGILYYFIEQNLAPLFMGLNN